MPAPNPPLPLADRPGGRLNLGAYLFAKMSLPDKFFRIYENAASSSQHARVQFRGKFPGAAGLAFPGGSETPLVPPLRGILPGPLPCGKPGKPPGSPQIAETGAQAQHRRTGTTTGQPPDARATPPPPGGLPRHDPCP